VTAAAVVIEVIIKTSLSTNIQRREMQVFKQESATSPILASQRSQVSQLGSIESSIVENAACRSLYTS